LPTKYDYDDDGICWTSLLSRENYKIVERNNGYHVAGYIMTLATKFIYIYCGKPIHFIDYIDTTIRGLKIAQQMMDSYENTHNCILIPQEIVDEAAEYWMKWICIKFDVEDVEIFEEIYIDIQNSIELRDEKLKWDYLASKRKGPTIDFVSEKIRGELQPTSK